MFRCLSPNQLNYPTVVKQYVKVTLSWPEKVNLWRTGERPQITAWVLNAPSNSKLNLEFSKSRLVDQVSNWAQRASVYTWHEQSVNKQSETCFQFHSLWFRSGSISSFTSSLWYTALADCYILLLVFCVVLWAELKDCRNELVQSVILCGLVVLQTKLLFLPRWPCQSIIKVTSCLSLQIRPSRWHSVSEERWWKMFIVKVLMSQLLYSMFTWEELT